MALDPFIRYEVYVDGFCYYSSSVPSSAADKFADYTARWPNKVISLREVKVLRVSHYNKASISDAVR